MDRQLQSLHEILGGIEYDRGESVMVAILHGNLVCDICGAVMVAHPVAGATAERLPDGRLACADCAIVKGG